MKKNAYLLNTQSSPCPGTHNAACNEFLNGFKYFGYIVSECNNIDNIIENEYTIILMSNHKIIDTYLSMLSEKFENCIFILWCYYGIQIPFKKYINTFSYFFELTETNKILYYNNLSNKNFQELRLLANEKHENIGTFEKNNIIYDSCFMGTPYKKDWTYKLDNVKYHDICNGLLNCEDRKKIYLQSLFALGFQAEANCLDAHVTQRIFEGMAYGCIVISESISATKMTNGIVEHVNNKYELEEKIKYFKENKKEYENKIKLGYEWVQKYGTNYFAAKLFMNKIDLLYFNGKLGIINIFENKIFNEYSLMSSKNILNYNLIENADDCYNDVKFIIPYYNGFCSQLATTNNSIIKFSNSYLVDYATQNIEYDNVTSIFTRLNMTYEYLMKNDAVYKIKYAVLFSTPFSNFNIGHDMSIILNYIHMYRERKLTCDIIISMIHYEKIIKIIKILLPYTNIIYITPNLIYKFENLIVFNSPAIFDILRHKYLINEIILEIKKKIIDITKYIGKNIILLKTNKQNIFTDSFLYPDEFYSVISKNNNFIIIDPEKDELFDIIMYLNNCNSIITSQGAIQYFNCIFLKNDAKMIVLYYDDRYNKPYYHEKYKSLKCSQNLNDSLNLIIEYLKEINIITL